MIISKKAHSISDDVIAGAVTGAVTRMITAPFDVLKIRFQLQQTTTIGGIEYSKYRTMLQAFSTIIREEGILALWNGNVSATYLWITYAVVQFSVYGMLKRYFEDVPVPFSGISSPVPTQLRTAEGVTSSLKSKKPASDYNSSRITSLWKAFLLFLAGAGAGITATISTYPFDIMRTQFAVQGKVKVYQSMSSFIIHTYKCKGTAGFFVGLTPAVVGIAPYMGLNFALFETLKRFANSPMLNLPGSNSSSVSGGVGVDDSTTNKGKPSSATKAMSLLKNGISGGIAGGVSKFVVYPLDTVKKRLQAQTLATMSSAGAAVFADLPKYTGIVNCIQTIYTIEGWRGFYKGIVPTIYKSVVSTAVAFAVYETTKEILIDRGGKESGRTSL